MADKFLLLVEGKDDFHVLSHLAEYHDIPESFKIKHKEGIENLLATLDVELLAGGLERLGIVVDADAAPVSRWEALRNVLIQSGYISVPNAPKLAGTIIEQKGKPRVGIWVMPDNETAGMLEDFVGSLVPVEDALWEYAIECVDHVVALDCRFPEGQRSKALIHTWLSWQKEPGTPLGLAIKNRELNPTSPTVQPLLDWLRQMFSTA